MANWTGAGAALSGGFMKAFEERRRQAEEEQSRRRQQEEIRNMMRSLGLGMPEGDIPVNMAGVVAQKGLNDQDMFKQEQSGQQQSEANRQYLEQTYPELYGGKLPPNINYTPDVVGRLSARADKMRQEQENARGMGNTLNTMRQYGQGVGVNIPDMGGRAPTQEEIDFFSGRINDAAGFQNQRALQDRSFNQQQNMLNIRDDMKNPEFPDTDMTQVVEEVRSAHRAARSIPELVQMTSDPDYQNAMKLIEEWSRPYWLQLVNEYYTMKNRLRTQSSTAAPTMP